MSTAKTADQKPDAAAAPRTAPLPSAGGRQINIKALMILGGALLATALVVWMVISSGKRKEQFATRELINARATAEQGNLPLAATRFQTVIDQFAGSDAAHEAVIGLNQVRLINGQSDLAAVALREFLATNPAPKFVAPSEGLLATALENARQWDGAAAAYGRAFEAATVDYLKAEYLVQQARVLKLAGKQQEAIAAYRQVLSDFAETPVATEATVRLAELTQGQIGA